MTVWERRDLPTLQLLATSDDEDLRNGFVSVGRREKQPLGTALAPGEFHDAMLALRDAGYIDAELRYSSGPTAEFTHFGVTGRGQQALGQWPLFEIASPETLALLLETLAEEAPTDEEAGNLRLAARYVRGLGAGAVRAAVVGAASHLARLGLGLG